LVLTDVFVPIIHYGHKDILVMREVMKAYRHMLEKAPGRNKTTIYEYARRLKQKMDRMSLHDEEYELINREFEEIQTRMA